MSCDSSRCVQLQLCTALKELLQWQGGPPGVDELGGGGGSGGNVGGEVPKPMGWKKYAVLYWRVTDLRKSLKITDDASIGFFWRQG